MAARSLPVVYVSETAKKKILGEVIRWARVGLSREGIPYEAIVYPLSTLLGRGRKLSSPSPLEALSITEIGGIVLADAAIPPDEVKSFSAFNCHFQAPNLEAIQQRFNAEIEATVKARPRLGVFSKLHSHPFEGGDFLSSGDLAKNVFHPGAIRWRERLGLIEAILHVVYPRRSVREIVGTSGGANGYETRALLPQGDSPEAVELSSSDTLAEVAEARRRNRVADQGVTLHASDQGLWGLATFAVDGTGRTLRLPGPIFVPDHHELVALALSSPFFATPEGKGWDDRQKAALAEAGLRPSRGVLERGWRRFIVSTGGKHDLVFCLPPDFPQRPLRVLAILDASRNLFQKLPIPRHIKEAHRLSDIDLVQLAKAYLKSPSRRAARGAQVMDGGR